MRAFIIRPFGTKDGINFDNVDDVLIAPALRAVGAEGGTTIDIVEAGNIRVDMFRRLLTADLVVADLSIHNANVFYELGIRHALRDHSTLMVRCDADKFPFDLQTDRYFLYKKEDPKAGLEGLIHALRRTIEVSAKDSPVFSSLPQLLEPDPSEFMAVPLDFGEEVGRAIANNTPGDLALLSYEVHGFEWEILGWRTVGRAQFNLKAHPMAKVTWEAVRKLEPQDLQANLLLGTIYERLGDLTRSTQALDRALTNKTITEDQRAEAYALAARNAKTNWRNEWEGVAKGDRAAVALRSAHLQESLENYSRGFREDLNHFYSGLNALAMLNITLALAEKQPDVWAEGFRTAVKASDALEEKKQESPKLAAAVELSLSAALQRLEREGKKDIWAAISEVDLAFIMADRPAKSIATWFQKVLTGAKEFEKDAVRKQLAIYRDLGVLEASLPEILKTIGEPPPLPEPGTGPTGAAPRKRVLLFAGHMIDAPGRAKPRFPAGKEQLAREKIREAVVQEMKTGAGVACGYAGGASGGDILFHEVCSDLGIPTRLYIAIPPTKYVVTSVSKPGPQWVTRFWELHKKHSDAGQVRVLSETEDAKNDRDYLPAWLRSKPDYSIWQRNNLWLLYNALNEATDPKSADPNITLIALWDGKEGDGPGGTGDLVREVNDMGAHVIHLNTRELFGID
jgi:tetratricopeptide (TPR) repeat protein